MEISMRAAVKVEDCSLGLHLLIKGAITAQLEG